MDRLAEGEAQVPRAFHVPGGDQGEYFRHLRLVAGRNFAVFGDGIGDAFADRRAVRDQHLGRFLAALLALDEAVGTGGGEVFLRATGEGGERQEAGRKDSETSEHGGFPGLASDADAPRGACPRAVHVRGACPARTGADARGWP